MKYIISSLLFLSVFACQPDKDFLAIHQKTDSIIGSGETHLYRVKLDKDQYCALVVQQEGIDIGIRLIGPEGDTLNNFDSPNGKWGPENISFFNGATGIYTLQVQPLIPGSEKGRYSIELISMEEKGRTLEKQVDQLFTFWDKKGSPGAAVAIAHEDKILYSKGYGYADLEYDIPNNPQTIFHIASLSKQFTAFSIALLAGQGKISLNDDIRKYLPELHNFGDTIRIRHLLHHTSGLRDQWNLLALAGWRLDDVITREQILRMMSRQTELNFSPGERMLYCNTGFTLLAEIVSRVSGQSFAAWTKDNIFDPLGMKNTLFYDDHEKIVPGRAYSYNDDKNGFKKSVLSYANVGATSLFTTVEDIMKWADNFRTMKVGSPDVMAMMNEKGILNNGDTLSYALGQFEDRYKGLKAIHHGGADAGYRTYLIRFPDQAYSIAVFSNDGSFDPGKIAYTIADIYLKDYFTPEKKEDKKQDAAKTENTTPVNVTASLLNEYTGRYSLMPGMVVEISLNNGILMAQATGQPQVRMVARSDTSFYIVEGDATLIFKRNHDQKVDRFTLLQGGAEINAPRLPDFDIQKVNLVEYEGSFYSPELQTSYTFKVKNDTLIAEHQRHDPIKLFPIKEDSFAGDQWFFGNLDFVRNSKKEITGCLVSSGRVLNIKFKKTDCLE